MRSLAGVMGVGGLVLATMSAANALAGAPMILRLEAGKGWVPIPRAQMPAALAEVGKHYLEYEYYSRKADNEEWKMEFGQKIELKERGASFGVGFVDPPSVARPDSTLEFAYIFSVGAFDLAEGKARCEVRARAVMRDLEDKATQVPAGSPTFRHSLALGEWTEIQGSDSTSQIRFRVRVVAGE